MATGDKIADKLVKLITDSGGLLFADQYDQTFFSPDGTGVSAMAIKSTNFKRFLLRSYHDKTGAGTNENNIREAISTIDALAYGGDVKHLDVRTAKRDGVVWYDLGAESVRIDKEGWEISTNTPCIFRRYPHQKTQVRPESGGHVSDILRFVNLTDPDQQILFMSLITSYFIPGFPHPVAAIYGSMGSGKSAMASFIKSLVDPSEVNYLSPPRSEEAFIQAASHHWLVSLDNLSYVPQWLSDALSRAVTGTGFSKRQLYTNDDDQIYSFKRAVVVNGINLVTQAPDLLDRSVIFSLERIPTNTRKKEAELAAEFQESKPKILGAIFDAVSLGLRNYDSIQLDEYPRMADFCQWGCAFAESLGFSQDDFITAYSKSIEKQHDEALDGSMIGSLVRDFMVDKPSWEGTPSELYVKLTELAETLKRNTRNKDWPKDPRWLMKKVELVRFNLQEKGIVVDSSREHEGRKITLTNRNVDETEATDEEIKEALGVYA